MKLKKPKFWKTKKSVIPFLLLPLTFLILIIIWIKRKLTKIIIFKTKVICIGNIFIGGTGKTPLSIFIANELLKSGKRPSIIRKFYKNHEDEYHLIKKNYPNLIVGKNRIVAIHEAIEKNFDTVVLDDGFQDYKIKKDFNILCFNNHQLIGNGFVMPSGPLRESFSSIKNADMVVINGNKIEKFENKVRKFNEKVSFYYSYYKLMNTEKFKDKKIMAVAGIGNPENFFTLLKENNLNVKEEIIYPDHHQFKKSELDILIKRAQSKNYQIVMTEKDYLRIKKFNYKSIDCSKIELVINNKKNLMSSINKIYD